MGIKMKGSESGKRINVYSSGKDPITNIDSELSTTSPNPVKNSVITEKLNEYSEIITKKLDVPETAGTAGQVLSLDDNLTPVWANGGGGSSGSVVVTPASTTGTKVGTVNGVALYVPTTNDAESDNTLPITSAGVNAIVGNIDVLLSII